MSDSDFKDILWDCHPLSPCLEVLCVFRMESGEFWALQTLGGYKVVAAATVPQFFVSGQVSPGDPSLDSGH